MDAVLRYSDPYSMKAPTPVGTRTTRTITGREMDYSKNARSFFKNTTGPDSRYGLMVRLATRITSPYFCVDLILHLRRQYHRVNQRGSAPGLGRYHCRLTARLSTGDHPPTRRLNCRNTFIGFCHTTGRPEIDYKTEFVCFDRIPLHLSCLVSG